MSRPDDRVAVPTNGHHPAQSADAGETTTARVDASAAGEADAASGPPAQVVDRPTVSTVTPGQMAAGFGIIAALIVLLVGRRRGPRD